MSIFLFIESNTTGTGRLFAKTARELGLSPVMLVQDPDRYCFIKDDKLDYVVVDTSNINAIFDACGSLKEAPAGVWSSSEYYISAAASCAKLLNLPAPNPGAIKICQNKYRQRTILRAFQIAVPNFETANFYNQAIEVAEQMGFPVIVKPIQGSGSSGVRLCYNVVELKEHMSGLLLHQTNERGIPMQPGVLIEEFMEGDEFSIETFGTTIVGITKKYVSRPPNFVEVGHDFPAVLGEETSAEIYQSVLAALKALDLEWGPVHTEIKLTNQGPMVVEVNPRLGGGFIPELVRLATGIDLISQTVRLASNRKTSLFRHCERYVSIRFIIPQINGTLESVSGVDEAKMKDEIVDVQLYFSPGTKIQKRGDFRDRVGHIIAQGSVSSLVRTIADSTLDEIHVKVMPLN